MPDDTPFTRLAAMVVVLTRRKRVGGWALNTLLWFADITHRLQHGRTLSGAAYARHGYGPYPENIDVVCRVLVNRKLIAEHIQESARRRVHAYQAIMTNIDVDQLRQVFTASEWRTLRAVTRILRGRPGVYLNEMSQRFEPWVGTRPGEALDLDRALSDETLRQWMTSIGLLPPPGKELQRTRSTQQK